MALGPSGLSVLDYFTPHNQEAMERDDADLGSGGPVLLPDQPGVHPRDLLIGGKSGILYLLDRDHLGKFQAADDSHAVQAIPQGPYIMGSPAYWNGHVFLLTDEGVIKDYVFRGGCISPEPISIGEERFAAGATPTVSASGDKNGIVWVIETKPAFTGNRPAVLHAYDATNVGRELYSSAQDAARDGAGWAVRFAIPTVADGRVYVGARGELDVYGLLPGADGR